ncbi:hypothetical protein MY11210_008242 [Beauveria gryllotalpidicola]
MDRALQRPDFGLVASNFREAADHFDRAANLPAVDGGGHLLERMEAVMHRITALEQTMSSRITALEQTMSSRITTLEQNMSSRITTLEQNMSSRITALEQTMSSRFDRVEGNLETLDRRMRVFEANSVARAQNSTAIREDSALTPLSSVNTGREIAQFPTTVHDAATLPRPKA